LPWSPSTGTGGRHPPETVVAFNRKPWSQWTGARTPGLRVVFHSPYAIYYLPRPDAIVIVRVIHGARDIAALAERGGFA